MQENNQIKFSSFCSGIGAAEDLCVAGKIETDKVIPLADKFYNWLLSKKVSE